MRNDQDDRLERLLRAARDSADALRRRRRTRRRVGATVLLPLLLVIVGVAIYSGNSPSRTPEPDADTFRASSLPSDPASLPVLVTRDLEQLAAVVDPSRPRENSDHELASLRVERRVTLLRAYAVLRYDDAGPLLEDVVDTATEERVRAEAVTMLGYVGYPSWRLLDELVDARGAGRDLMPHLRALRYFFSAATEPPAWLRDAVRELVAIADECSRLECRRAAAGAIARATWLSLDSDWIREIESLARNEDHECRVRALDSLRGATASNHPDRSVALIAASLTSPHESEVVTAISRLTSVRKIESQAAALPALKRLAGDPNQTPDVRSSAGRAIQAVEGPERLGQEPVPVARAAHSIHSSDDVRGLLRNILEDRSNAWRFDADVVQERRRAYAEDPLRRIVREIRREVLR